MRNIPMPERVICFDKEIFPLSEKRQLLKNPHLVVMFKRFLSILFLCSALAIILGHDFIPHHHHYEQDNASHDHHGGKHQHNDTDENCDDWSHAFSHFQHDVSGLSFITGCYLGDDILKQNTQFTALHASSFVFKHGIIDCRQNAPPYIVDYRKSQNYLPCRLRAPPVFIV